MNAAPHNPDPRDDDDDKIDLVPFDYSAEDVANVLRLIIAVILAFGAVAVWWGRQ